MLAHIHALQAQAEQRLYSINSKTVQTAETLHNELVGLDFLELEAVLTPDNQYHRYYFNSTGLDEPMQKLHHKMPQLNLRQFVRHYMVLVYYGTTLLATLINGFFPQKNFRFRLPSRKPGKMHEIAGLIVLCQQAYNPAHEEQWEAIRSQISNLLGALGIKEAANKNRSSSSYMSSLKMSEHGEGKYDPCAIEPHKALAVTFLKNASQLSEAKARLVLSKQRWPELLALVQPGPDGLGVLGRGEIESIANIGRVPWDIRQQSLVIRVGGQERLRIYNNIDYELVPHVGGLAVQKFEMRCILLEMLLYLMLDQKTRADKLMNELRNCAARADELSQPTGVLYVGVHYPQDEFLNEVRLLAARKRQLHAKSSAMNSIIGFD